MESRRNSDWTPFDVAQGRGEHSRTTIETFGGDEFGLRHSGLSIPRSLLLSGFIHSIVTSLKLQLKSQ